MIKHLVALLVSLLAAQTALAGTQYHGFQIDAHLMADGQALPAAVVASITGQIDIVEAVGLPAPVLEAFRQTPLLVDPAVRGNPGVFIVQDGEGQVRLQPIVFPSNKPILLHELLHAYHFKVLALGNPDILGAYRRAKGGAMFPADYQAANFLSNPKEYFAVTASIYLFGNIQQAPFRCQALAKLGPDYLAFLAAQFGPHECK